MATLYPAPPRPGFGRFVQAQLETLARRGDWDVTVINPIGLPPLLPLRRYAALRGIPAVETPEDTGGAVTVYHPRFALIPGLSGRFNPALIARAVLSLARRLHAQTPFDLVDAQFFYPDGPAAARIARALGLPLAIKARGADIHYWGSLPPALAQIRAAAAQARVLLSVSAALAQDMATLGLPAERIRVHYTGLDHARFHPRPRDQARAALAARHPALTFAADARVIACVGALIPRKGADIAISALRDLPADVVLVLAGTGEFEGTLRQQVADAGLSARVRFAGALGHDDLPLLLNAAEAMVLPSASEGLANAWVEALASGTPIVIPDIGGARELVDRAAAGRIAPREPAAIAQAIAEVLAARMPQDQVAASAAHFSWDANAAALAQIYCDAVRTA
ncbi:glycosyltransferase [Novosphingobium sp.]|uniref:glycosyltransferase n=1 Tax=Novosphingobium sp. TaxID=1874826 RepID=UPI00334289F7